MATTRFVGHRGWVILAGVCALIGVMAVASAVVGLFAGEPGRVLWALLGLPFWYWIGVGAWRRAGLRPS